MNEEYEILMRFHLLTCGADLRGLKYATVDLDGVLCCFAEIPTIDPHSRVVWTNENQSTHKHPEYLEIYKIQVPVDFTKTMIEL